MAKFVLGNSQQKALDLLFAVVDLLDENHIPYFLEGGTLLGIVRDGALIPWDHDLDISVAEHDSDKAARVLSGLKLKGFKITKRQFSDSYMPLQQGQLRMLKVKKFFPNLVQQIKSAFSQEPATPMTLDIFIKYDHEGFSYWEAAKKVMRVPSVHYQRFEELEFMGRMLKVPAQYKDYLQLKFGDWQTPVKDWSCSRDERTIVGEIGK